MPAQRPRVFSREVKEAAVRRVVTREKVRALAAELQVWPKLLYHWWDRYEWGGLEALEPPGRPSRSAGGTERPRPTPSARSRKARTQAKEKRRTRDEVAAAARVAELERKIGQQAPELDFFARALRHVKAFAPPSRCPGHEATRSDPCSTCRERVGRGQARGVLLEALDTEELCRDWRFDGLGRALQRRKRAGHLGR
jgi:transposase